MQKNNNRAVFNRLRKEYPVMFYKSYNYSLDGSVINVDFEFKLSGDIIFKPSASISVPHIPQLRENIHCLIDNIVFHIGLVEFISYWKSTCSPLIVIECAKLTNKQCEWWKDLFYNGLGEFLYLNDISIGKDELVEIKSDGIVINPCKEFSFSEEYIVPVGGGKDSAVSLELLIKNKQTVHPLIMNPRGATIDTVIRAGIRPEEIIVINRTIYPLLLELNEKGFLNGHTPFSAMLAFYSLLVSAVTSHKNIALSNESSANEATIPGTDINHQYSKSLDFEKKFREYYSEFISPAFNYFSFLRPLNELQIVAIFSELVKYHDIFKSCNAGSKENKWCGHCPKCLFTHIMLSAYKGISYADKIIGTSMLNDENNVKDFDELTGISSIKPFECVGTLNDVQTAVQMIVSTHIQSELPVLIKRFEEKKNQFKPPVNVTQTDSDHFLTDYQLSILREALHDKLS